MSFDTRNNSAIIKRAEQLKRWEDSDTNRAPATPKDPNTRKVKFSAGCVFLAACLSGDKEDILRLIENGVDIDTANVDGLTALHQVIIFAYFLSKIKKNSSFLSKTLKISKNFPLCLCVSVCACVVC